LSTLFFTTPINSSSNLFILVSIWSRCQVYNLSIFSNCSCKVFFYLTCNLRFLLQCGIFFHSTTTTIIFASQGLRSALLIFTLGIVRRIFKVTRWRFICNAASGICNQSERALHFPSSCLECPENWLEIIIWLIFKRRFVKNLIKNHWQTIRANL
jgi:hypothetical protein